MRVITANLNGIRSAHTKGFFDWLNSQDADIVCVQETKIQAAQMPLALLAPQGFAPSGWFHYAKKAGYSGVGIYAKVSPDAVYTGFDAAQGGEFDAEGRLVRLDFPKLTVLSAYFPSGSSGEVRQAAKFRFLNTFLPYFQAVYAESQAAGREVLLCGDINIAHAEIDLKNWRSNLKNSGFTADERAWLSQFLNPPTHIGAMVDMWRYLYPSEPGYTWWSNRGAAYANNVGWRIDYQLASPQLAAVANQASIYKDQKFSDHAPLIVDYVGYSLF